MISDFVWGAWVVAFVAFELRALLNDSAGDTLSGLVWRTLRAITRGERDRQMAIAGVLGVTFAWLVWHFVFQPTMPQ